MGKFKTYRAGLINYVHKNPGDLKIYVLRKLSRDFSETDCVEEFRLALVDDVVEVRNEKGAERVYLGADGWRRIFKLPTKNHYKPKSGGMEL